MPGSKSRDKGARRELEAAKALGASKISRMRQKGPDLLYGDRYVEVKALKDGWKLIYKWLSNDASLLMLKADRKPWLITMSIDEFHDLQEEAYGNGWRAGRSNGV